MYMLFRTPGEPQGPEPQAASGQKTKTWRIRAQIQPESGRSLTNKPMKTLSSNLNLTLYSEGDSLAVFI